MTTLVYLHGFNSAPESAKGQLLRRAASELPRPPTFHLPRLEVSPVEAMHDVSAWIEQHVVAGEPCTFIGSSLGGFYATWLAERYEARAVVINPAIRPNASLESFLGEQRNLYTGETYELTRAHIEEMRALTIPRITRPDRYLLLVRSGDELLDWREAVRYYAGASQYVGGGGDHGWSDFAPMLDTVLRFAGCQST
ncbi:MAG: esterase [Pseudomonadota bacterium]|nr:esterase [Pseudomonadota bacterium]